MRIRVHPLLWLTLAGTVWTGYFIEMVTLLLLILVHELGHLTVAWSYGWRIRSLQLFPFGGVAEVENNGYTPWQQEVVVALAGPFNHILFLGVGWFWQTVGKEFFALPSLSAEWIAYVVQSNIWLALFNLLPIQPLDGGRVMQALLSCVLPWRQARLWMFYCSWGGAILLGVVAYLGSTGIAWHLFLLALFLGFTNSRDRRQLPYQQLRFLLHRWRWGPPPGAPTVYLRWSPETPLSTVFQKFYRERSHTLLLRGTDGKMLALSERLLLRWYFTGQLPHASLRNLLRSWYV